MQVYLHDQLFLNFMNLSFFQEDQGLTTVCRSLFISDAPIKQYSVPVSLEASITSSPTHVLSWIGVCLVLWNKRRNILRFFLGFDYVKVCKAGLSYHCASYINEDWQLWRWKLQGHKSWTIQTMDRCPDPGQSWDRENAILFPSRMAKFRCMGLGPIHRQLVEK